MQCSCVSFSIFAFAAGKSSPTCYIDVVGAFLSVAPPMWMVLLIPPWTFYLSSIYPADKNLLSIFLVTVSIRETSPWYHTNTHIYILCTQKSCKHLRWILPGGEKKLMELLPQDFFLLLHSGDLAKVKKEPCKDMRNLWMYNLDIKYLNSYFSHQKRICRGMDPVTRRKALKPHNPISLSPLLENIYPPSSVFQ